MGKISGGNLFQCNPSLDLNRTNHSLHSACRKGLQRIVPLLLEKGFDINELQAGETPLHAAMPHQRVAALLVRLGANVHAPNAFGQTPLHLACQTGQVGMVRLLLSRGVNVDVKDYYKKTPLHMACLQSSEAMASILLKKSSSWQETDLQGNTPLHLACSTGLLQAAIMLISKGALIHSEDRDGFTPIQIACKAEHVEIVLELIRRGGGMVSIWSLASEAIRRHCEELFTSIPILKTILQECKTQMDLIHALQVNIEVIIEQSLHIHSTYMPLEVAFFMGHKPFIEAMRSKLIFVKHHDKLLASKYNFQDAAPSFEQFVTLDQEKVEADLFESNSSVDFV